MVKLLKLLKATWFTLCIVVLVVTLYFGDAETGRDIDVFLIWSMMILSFPASWIIILLYSGITYLLYMLFSVSLTTDGVYMFYGYLFITWVTFFVVGYLQWFKLIPWLIEKGKKGTLPNKEK